MNPKLLATLFAISLAVGVAEGATPVLTYEFNNSLAPDENGGPVLVATDPLGQNGFLVDMVFGESDNVYRFSGNALPPSQQAGLSLNTTGYLTPNNYSAELVFSFDGTSGWRRIIDVQDRQSDNGFYVDPSNHLSVFGGGGTSGPNTFTPGYHHVILTVASNGTVKGYIDGLNDLAASTSVMNITNSANNTMSLFLDNVVGGGQGEFSSGNIAQLRLYNAVLTDAEALALSQNPIVPEPSSILLVALALPALFGCPRFRAAR